MHPALGRAFDSEKGEDQQSTQEHAAVTNFTPSTTGHVTPLRQSAAGTPVRVSSARSPMDFNKHREYLRKATQSPGEGFMYTGRCMFRNKNNQVRQVLVALQKNGLNVVVFNKLRISHSTTHTYLRVRG